MLIGKTTRTYFAPALVNLCIWLVKVVVAVAIEPELLTAMS